MNLVLGAIQTGRPGVEQDGGPDFLARYRRLRRSLD